MKNLQIACCFHPTTVFLVDDNRKFLTNLATDLSLKNIAYQLNHNSAQAVQFLKEEYKADSFIRRCLLRPEEQYKDHRSIDVDVRAIHQEVYRPGRFKEIAVIVVDFAMPGLNGGEFCKQLSGYPFKIILLTGEADEKIAIDLFNQGFIHKFIRKDMRDFEQILIASIHELQQEYFKDLSEIVVNSLTKNPDYPPCCLDDPVFINFFEQFAQQHHFAEYYLLEETGSFLFLDNNAKPSLLIVKDESEMKAALFDAETQAVEVPVPIIEALKARVKILHRYTAEDYRKHPAEWSTLMHPAKKLEGRAIYYYAYVDDAKLCPLDAGKVLSYKAYLSQL